MKTIKKLISEYHGIDRQREEKIFKKCEDLVIDSTRYLKYETLRKLVLYTDLALKKLRK